MSERREKGREIMNYLVWASRLRCELLHQGREKKKEKEREIE